MNRADRRRARKFAGDLVQLQEQHGDPDWRCASCGRQDGVQVEVCMAGCCAPVQRCAACAAEVMD
jgi:hypothetical protein